jgi:hypothetical protein
MIDTFGHGEESNMHHSYIYLDCIASTIHVETYERMSWPSISPHATHAKRPFTPKSDNSESANGCHLAQPALAHNGVLQRCVATKFPSLAR